jgi:hypothetical protein
MQNATRIFAFMGGLSRLAITASLIWIPFTMGVSAHSSAQTTAQEAAQGAEPTASIVVPQQVRYAGKMANRAGDTVEAEFRIYAAQQGGEPSWTETQQVTVGQDGSYAVLLGAASPPGLPQTVFAGGVARWLGISVERSTELDRVLLASVPYAMKSADAEALAGHAASDFVTQQQLAQFAQLPAQAGQSGSGSPEAQPDTSGTVTGSGTAGTVPLWTGALTQGNSEIVQVGSDIGIHEATPEATLDVGGTATIRGATTLEGTTTLPPQAPATTASGYASQLLDFSASAWSSTAVAPVNQTFRLFSYPTGNNTATPSGTLFLQFQEGTGPVANILTIGSNGVIGFNSAQTFPGTIKSVSATSPVTAATTSGAVSLGLNTAGLETTLNGVYAQLSAANTFTKPITFAPGQTFPVTGTGGGTITGVTAGTDLTGGGTTGAVTLNVDTTKVVTGVVAGTGLTGGATGGMPTLAVDTTKVPLLNAQNSFSNTNTFAGTINAQGTLDLEATGVTSSFAPTLNSALLELSANAYNSTEGIPEALNFGWQAVATGGNTGSPSANLKLLYGSGSAQPAATGLSIAPSGVVTFASGQTFPGGGAGGTITGVTAGAGLTGGGTTGTVSLSVPTAGVADSMLANAYSGTGSCPAGSAVTSLGRNLDPTCASFGTGTITGITAGTGITTTGGPSPTLGIDSTVVPLLAANNTFTGNLFIDNNLLEVYDTGDVPAVEVVNEGEDTASATMFLENNNSTGEGGVVLYAGGPNYRGQCSIDVYGNLECSGTLTAVIPAGGGTRKVETYSVQSPENWMEDFGSGELQKGVAVVTIDPAFAETVTADASYHVFITPSGDSKGLYVINKTANTFEVRESGGGSSSLSFDYRVVAKRRGYEAQRLTDVTERFDAEHTQLKRRMPATMTTAK